MIVASLPTIPQRRQTCLQVIRRILFEQTRPPDALHVWLNGYTEIPSEFPTDARVHYHLHPENPGPWIRYKVVDELSDNDVLVTIDDDLVYPCDYVGTAVQWLEHVSPRTVISFGGFRWDPCVAEYHYGENRRHFNYADVLTHAQALAVLMGCVAAFPPLAARAICGPAYRGFEYNDDLYISTALQQRGFGIVCPAKPQGWIQEFPEATASHALWVRDRANRKRAFLHAVKDFGLDPSASALAEFLQRSERILVVADSALPLDPASDIHQYLESLCADDVSVHLLAPVAASKAGDAQRFVDRPYWVHSVAVPEDGGRLEWLEPVRRWRSWRVQRDGRRRIEERLKVVLDKLKPTQIERLDSNRAAMVSACASP